MLILRLLFSEVSDLGSIFINALQKLLIGVIRFPAYIGAEHFCGKHSCNIGIIEFTAVTSGSQYHIRELGCFAGRFVCQKDNGSPLLMYHLRSEIHQPGIPGVGDKNSRLTCFQITGKIKHVLSMTSVIIYVRKCLSEDRDHHSRQAPWRPDLHGLMQYRR